MTQNSEKQLCLSLMHADTEEEIISILKKAGYWDDQSAWQIFGDNENNYSTIGNQGSYPDAAFIEKLVNSVDARLTNECLVNGINPESEQAPKSIREAVARFFDGVVKETASAGLIRDWTETKRTEIARGISVAATGAKPGTGNPCFSIADIGEGQGPLEMPNTFLSLNKSNKLRIHFVQGKFNMGGTGVLRFCGKKNFQLIVSRRNPKIIEKQKENSKDCDMWGFTIVRREDPQGNRRSSVYTYLAPNNDGNGVQGVLRFRSDEMPLFPQGNRPYSKNTSWGTLIKLYEYSAAKFRSHILMKDGLLSRVDLLLPDVALPMRFHECRDYRGHSGSSETTLTGVRVRLDDDKGQNLEEGFPTGAPFRVAGEDFHVTIYAFKKKRSEAYRKNEGVIFVVNGQTHGHLTQDFFLRKNVGLSYLADSILVVVDCTKLSGRAREDLFMNSRDRLSAGELRHDIEDSLEDLLKHHQGLRDLKERRRREEIESKIDDAKPLEDILAKLLKQSPTLANLFLKGIRAATPFKTTSVQEQESKYQGKRFPTYFKFRGKEYGQQLHRETPVNMKSRVTFETDASNDFFTRHIEPGTLELLINVDGEYVPASNSMPHLWNGIATLSVKHPDTAKVGDLIKYRAILNDPSRIDPLVNEFGVELKWAQHSTGGGGNRTLPPNNKPGQERDQPSGIQMPKITLVFENEWQEKTPPFNKYTALRIVDAGSGGEASDNASVYDFFINMDNLYLKMEMKTSSADPDLTKAQFQNGMALIGLAMLHQDLQDQQSALKERQESDEQNESKPGIERRVDEFSRAVAPVIIPMINSLGALSADDQPASNVSGEAT
jgi:hypothetical protein